MEVQGKRNFFVFRLLISLILITFIITKVDTSRLVDLFSSIRFPLFFLALFLVFVERVLLAYRWNVLLAAKKMDIPFLKIVKIYYLGNFVGTFLPSSIGVDILRVYNLYKFGSNPSESISSVLVDRIIALFSSLTVVLVNLIFFSNMIKNQYLIWSIIGITICFFISLMIIINTSIMRVFFKIFDFLNKKIAEKIHKCYDSFFEFLLHKPMLFYALVLSLLFQVIRVFGVYLVSLSLNQSIDVIYFFIFVPIIIVVALLPFSLGGIGIREGAYVFFFSQVGMSISDAFALSILVYALTMFSIIPGGIIYVLEGSFVKREGTAKG